MYCNAEDLRIVKFAEEICDGLWYEVNTWDWLAKKIVGIQLVKAADSIGANISEGQGRHHKFDNIRFIYISRGSLEETFFWLRRAKKRSLLNQIQFEKYSEKLNDLRPQLNAFIKAKLYKEKNLSISQSYHHSIQRGGERNV